MSVSSGSAALWISVQSWTKLQRFLDIGKKNMLPVFNMVGATAADVTFKDVLGEEVGACT
jgi:hypothetical protein